MTSMRVLHVRRSPDKSAKDINENINNENNQFDIKVNADCVTSIAEAFNRLQQDPFDAVILESEEIEPIREMMNFLCENNLKASVPVIVLSQKDDYKLTLEAIKLGVKDFLGKNSLTTQRLVRSLAFASYPKLMPKKNSWFGL